MALEHKDIMELIVKEAGIVNGLWQNYATVSGVLLAFGVAGANLPHLGRIGGTLAFTVFSCGNLALILQAARVQMAARSAIDDASTDMPKHDGLINALLNSTNSVTECRAYHYVIDVAVLAAIWIPALAKQ